MTALLLAAALACPEPKIVAPPKFADYRDLEMLERAKKRCAELYRESPCVGEFIVRAPGVYRVICTHKRKGKG